MYYRLIADFPKHEKGEFLYKKTDFYEWVEQPNYLLPKDVVEDSINFFEEVKIDWKVGDNFCYISSLNEIIEHKFNPKAHLKLVISNNCFKNKQDAQKYIDKCLLIKNNDNLIINKNDIEEICNNISSGYNNEAILLCEKILKIK